MARESRADTAWSNRATTSSSWSIAACATNASRIGYLRSSRRSSAWFVDLRATVARNRRRSFGSADRSTVCASIARSHNSLSIDVFTADAVASRAPCRNHSSRVIPNPTSTIGSRSRSARTSSVSRCPSSSVVSAVAPVRASPTILASTVGPGRTTCADIRYSRARLNSNVELSCSIALSSRNWVSSFNAWLPGAVVFQPRYLTTSFRWSVRVWSRRPYPCNAPGCSRNCSANRATAVGGTDATSSGTNPSQDNVPSWTASPSSSCIDACRGRRAACRCPPGGSSR